MLLAVAAAVALLITRASRRRNRAARWPDDLHDDVEWPLLYAYGDTIGDCGCPDIYFCPASSELECPRHSAFTTCCNQPEQHLPVRRAG